MERVGAWVGPTRPRTSVEPSRTATATQSGHETDTGELARSTDSVASVDAVDASRADPADVAALTRPTIESVPPEVRFAICRYLGLRDVLALGETSSRFRSELDELVAGLPQGCLSHELTSSVRSGDVPKVRALLRFGAVRRLVNDLDDWGRSPLWWAARGGDLRLVRHLLAVPGIDVNRCNPLWIATAVRATCVVRALLRRGANVNARENAQTNAVLDGMSLDGGWTVRTLLGSMSIRCGALVRQRVRGERGDRRDEVAPGLSRADALACARSHPSHAPLRIAAQRGSLPIVRWLLRDPRIRPNRDVPIVGAALNGHRAIVDLLLARPDVDVNRRDSGGLNAIHAAILRGRARVVERLLESGRVTPDLEFAYAALSSRGAVRVISVMESCLRWCERVRADALAGIPAVALADAVVNVPVCARADASADAPAGARADAAAPTGAQARRSSDPLAVGFAGAESQATCDAPSVSRFDSNA
ncbi:MAG TPA: ankyrin repeat domain-containing F-box protein [Pararobbsia sp.]|nr:ankyrin repeat domain-containing F-box protein [Pararobbsia sp.]